MKRVKLMLLSLLVLGVVGGAMAFKVKFSADYCTTPIRIAAGVHVCTDAGGAALKCPNLIENVTHGVAQQFNVWCTTTAPIAGCNANLNCITTPVSLAFD